MRREGGLGDWVLPVQRELRTVVIQPTHVDILVRCASVRRWTQLSVKFDPPSGWTTHMECYRWQWHLHNDNNRFINWGTKKGGGHGPRLHLSLVGMPGKRLRCLRELWWDNSSTHSFTENVLNVITLLYKSVPGLDEFFAVCELLTLKT